LKVQRDFAIRKIFIVCICLQVLNVVYHVYEQFNSKISELQHLLRRILSFLWFSHI